MFNFTTMITHVNGMKERMEEKLQPQGMRGGSVGGERRVLRDGGREREREREGGRV
jgi:hypothetical protein